jgi:hypothetical protein
MKSFNSTFLLLLLLITARSCSSQTTKTNTEDSITGTWKGTSLCQVKNSPCHDEDVVYHISKGKTAGWYILLANKIVNGAEEEMGALDFVYDKIAGTLTCTMTNQNKKSGVWRFFIKNNHINGTLVGDGDVLYRKIEVDKQ